ncbi:hypothetical protein PoB_003105000 [Plakobranchus ocellatus]|uniref:Uncharacterized protein n=1 Tax=Plakobranchus ocellatus TaxID=259542 RepID=A0AAV4ACK1_9GAST|nr:hypothetical protein PoB_003105000 [Plakobranchus ocellatus]
MACANVPKPSSQASDSDTIIAGSIGSEFNIDVSSEKDGRNAAQVASTHRSRTDSPISGRITPATDQGVGDYQWQYLVEEEDLNPVECFSGPPSGQALVARLKPAAEKVPVDLRVDLSAEDNRQMFSNSKDIAHPLNPLQIMRRANVPSLPRGSQNIGTVLKSLLSTPMT